MNKRYDWIRNMAVTGNETIQIDYRVTEDLSKFGGPITLLREFNRTFGRGFNPADVADEVEAFVKEMVARADSIANAYKFETIVKVD